MHETIIQRQRKTGNTDAGSSARPFNPRVDGGCPSTRHPSRSEGGASRAAGGPDDADAAAAAAAPDATRALAQRARRSARASTRVSTASISCFAALCAIRRGALIRPRPEDYLLAQGGGRRPESSSPSLLPVGAIQEPSAAEQGEFLAPWRSGFVINSDDPVV